MKRKIRIALRIEERLVIHGGLSAGETSSNPGPPAGGLGDYLNSLLESLRQGNAVPTALVSQSKKQKDKSPCNDE
jgi:hypothetical protein